MLAPTRELAQQIEKARRGGPGGLESGERRGAEREEGSALRALGARQPLTTSSAPFTQVMRALGDYLNVKCHACVGGTSVREDTRILQSGVHVVVGTPGRVYDMLRRRALRADSIKMFVLDEADEMLSRGFKDQIYDIFQLLPPKIQAREGCGGSGGGVAAGGGWQRGGGGSGGGCAHPRDPPPLKRARRWASSPPPSPPRRWRSRASSCPSPCASWSSATS